MARTIGRKYKNMVKRFTFEELKKATSPFGETQFSGIENAVVNRLPVELWDTWESADSEIRNLIDDAKSDFVDQKHGS